MKMNKYWCALLVGIVMTVSGCGVQKEINATQSVKAVSDHQGQSNITPSKKLPAPINKFDPVKDTNGQFSPLVVTDASGKSITLNAKTTPIILEAYWCPHCQRELTGLSRIKSSLKIRPVLVSMGFKNGTTIKEAVNITTNEFKSLGITGFKTYYLLNPKPLNYIFPTLLFSTNGSATEELVGEHTVVVVKEALNQSAYHDIVHIE